MNRYTMSIVVLLLLLFTSCGLNYVVINDNETIYHDNGILIDKLEEQNKTVKKLMKNGWSQEKAENFVSQGCLMYIEVM